MTHNVRKLIIETLSMRIFEIQDIREKLEREEEALRARVCQLETGPMKGDRIIDIGSREIDEAW